MFHYTGHSLTGGPVVWTNTWERIVKVRVMSTLTTLKLFKADTISYPVRHGVPVCKSSIQCRYKPANNGEKRSLQNFQYEFNLCWMLSSNIVFIM